MGDSVKFNIRDGDDDYAITLGKGGPILKGLELGMEYAQARKQKRPYGLDYMVVE